MRVVAGVSALLWGLFFFGVIDLLVAIEQTPGFYESYVLETGWGVLYTFLVALPLISLTLRPRAAMPSAQMALVGVAVAVTAVASGSWGQLLPAGLLLLNAALLARLARGRQAPTVEWRRPRLDLATAAVGAVLVPPAVAYAVDMIAGYREGRPPTDDDTWGLDHWPMQAALALAVVGIGLGVAAGARHRWSGTVVSAGSVSLAAAWFGITCAVYPDHAGSVGRTWGVLVAVWAGIFALTSLWRSTGPGSTHPPLA